jgi:hypothetical protein
VRKENKTQENKEQKLNNEIKETSNTALNLSLESWNLKLYYVMAIVAPSFLASNFLRLEEACNMVNSSEAEWFHLDVMGWCVCAQH